MKEKLTFQNICSLVSMICMIIITITVLVLYKNVTGKLNKLQEDEQRVMTNIETVANDINEVAADLQEADLPGIAENINNLTSDATGDLALTMEKIDSINIDALNNSINRLDAATGSFESAVSSFMSIFPSF